MNTMRAVGWGKNSPRRFTKLARIVGLAAIMMLVGALPSEATTIVTRNFDSTTLVQDYRFLFDPGDVTPYATFRVGFDEVVTPFSLTITDNWLSKASAPSLDSVAGFGDGFECVEITNDGQCVEFVASRPGGLPQPTTHFNGNITIGISYGIHGWPLPGSDPVDIGITDNFSSFMLYATSFPAPTGQDPFDFRIVHFSTANPLGEDITVANCPGLSSINECAQLKGYPNFVVPEPASVTAVAWGLLGLTFLGRRLKRRN